MGAEVALSPPPWSCTEFRLDSLKQKLHHLKVTGAGDTIRKLLIAEHIVFVGSAIASRANRRQIDSQ